MGQSTSSPPRSVAVVPGWAEGKWLAKKFVHALEDSGFIAADDPYTADIIFAHSLGCYRIPKDAPASLVLLVGVPLGPNRSLPPALVRKLRSEARYHHRHHQDLWWLKKLAYNCLRILVDPRADYLVLAGRRAENLPSATYRKVVAVRPEADVFMVPNGKQLLVDKGYEYIEVPGEHDGCWVEPSKYIDLLKSLC